MYGTGCKRMQEMQATRFETSQEKGFFEATAVWTPERSLTVSKVRYPFTIVA
jgi:hypothetical protein